MIKNLSVYSSKGIRLNKTAIHKIVSLLKDDLKFCVESLQFNFVLGEEIHKINKKYLKHDFTTDIITFNYSGKFDNLDGEIFISIDDALRNSKKYEITLDNEITRLVIHGILHMLGYDDIKPADKRKMKIEEDRLVNLFSKKLKESIALYAN